MNVPQPNAITSDEARTLVTMLNKTWPPVHEYEEFHSALRKLIIIANEKPKEERK